MKTTIFILLISLTGCVTITPTSGPRTALDYKNIQSTQFPDDFKQGNFILLIEKSEDKGRLVLRRSDADYINYFLYKNWPEIKAFADSNCKIKHEFATDEEIHSKGSNDSKFQDKNIYRYALITSIGTPDHLRSYTDHFGHTTYSNYPPMFKYYIYDRLNDKVYGALINSNGSHIKAYKAAIKKINEGK